MSEDDAGFLSEGLAVETKATCEEEYGPWLQVVRRINGQAVRTQHLLAVSPDDVQQVLAASLFARTLSTVQAAVLMIERGMPTQARILLRAAMDSVFNLVAVCLSAEYGQRFLAADQISRRKMFRKATMWHSPELQTVSQDTATDEKLAEINADIREANARDLTSEEAAKAAGLHDWYLTAYAVFSFAVHSNVRDLESHLVIGDKNKILGLKNEPDLSESDALLTTSAELLLKALRSVGQLFGVDAEHFYKDTYQELRQLHETRQADGEVWAEEMPGSGHAK